MAAERERDEEERGSRRTSDGGASRPALRRVALWGGGLVAGLLVLYLAAVLGLRVLLPPETLARWAEPRAEAALNRDVEIGGAELAVFPHLGVALRDVTVGNLAGFRGPPLARLERAELRVALLPLVRGDVVMDEASATGVDLRLQVDEDGDSNFGDLLPASEEERAGPEAGAAPVSLPIREVHVERGRFELRDRRTGRAVVLDSVEASGSLAREESGRLVRLEAGSRAVTVVLSDEREGRTLPGDAEARLRLRTSERFESLEVLEGRLTAGGVPLTVSGRVDSLRSPVRHLSLTLRADTVPLGRLVGARSGVFPADSVEGVEGTISLRVGLTGPVGGAGAPRVDGRLELRGAGGSLAGRGRVVDGLSGRLLLRDDTLVAEGVRGTLLGGRARLAGRLERWPQLLAGSEPRPRLRLSVRSDRLDLGRLLRRPEHAPTYGRLLFARIGSDSLDGRAAGETAAELGVSRPGPLPGRGVVELAVDTLLVPPRLLESVDARVEFGPGLIRVDGAEFVVDGGRLRQSLTVALGEAERQPFSFAMRARGLRAGEFLAASTPLGRLATGTMSLELRAAGLLDRRLLPHRDSLTGSGRLTVEGGGLAENPVTASLARVLSYPPLRSPSLERADVPFTVRGSSVTFDTARLATAAADLDWTGSVDLADGLEIGARLRVPRSRLGELDLDGIGLPAGLPDRLRGGEGPLELGLRVGGTLGSPRFRPDPDALAAGVREAAAEAAEERLERERGRLEERARGLLRGLAPDTAPTPARDTTPPPAPPDSAAARGGV